MSVIQTKQVGVEIHELVRQYIKRTGETDYWMAYYAVKSDPENADAVRQYGES
jgi:hypothetical protein